MKVLMVPHISQIKGRTSGINRVVAEYFKELPQLGIELVDPSADSYDIKVSHAGAKDNKGDWPNVAMTHGLYWTSDHNAPKSEYSTNERVIQAVRHAKEVTVPSPWVAEAFQRDMRFTPHVIPHGIRTEEWQHDHKPANYVLWNKNRANVTCDPSAVTELARDFPETQFVTTFATSDAPQNVSVTGVVPHDTMKMLVQRAGVYLSTTKETFGIGVLEAMAAGVPVLGWAQGGNLDLVQHGVNGYLAQTGNYDDLAAGLAYCSQYQHVLGRNGAELAERYTWRDACEILAGVFRLACATHEPTVDIVIPCYNYSSQVGRAIESACNQSYNRISSIIVVDDGSRDDGATERIVNEWCSKDARVRYIRQDNSGVAVARNRGCAAGDARYIACLDADDAIEPDFITRLVPVLEADNSLGIAYTAIRIVTRNGRTGIGTWPTEFDYDEQLRGQNQIPTCCLFRREMWERLGGYRQRYAPDGAGAEDAELWLRAGAAGYGAVKATNEPLFVYSMGTGNTARPEYRETDWLGWHPWAHDGMHPFASVAGPKFKSHPVRQYDEPLISVVIPVAEWHTSLVVEALDSLEAQTMRKWEVILVDDTGIPTNCDNCEDSWLDAIRMSYPYVRVVSTPGEMGAGYSRNRGVDEARAPLLLFLDADDFLKPTALERMVIAFNEYQCAIYTDFEAQTTGVSNPDALHNSVKFYDERDGYAVISKRALDYDWRRVHAGIENPPYIWNLITTLFPTSWHYEIGGFDEAMPSWEDYDYWVRMSYEGKPFLRLPEELVVYLYHTGRRREDGNKMGGDLLHYIMEKYKDMPRKDCKGCGKTVGRPVSRSTVFNRASASRASRSVPQVNDDDFIRCEYTHPNKGQHHVFGVAQFDERMAIPSGYMMNMVEHEMGGYRFYYGYIGGGQKVLVHRRDAQTSRFFTPVAPVTRREVVEIAAPAPVPTSELAPPESISEQSVEPTQGIASVPRLEDIFVEDRVDDGDVIVADNSATADTELTLDKSEEISYSSREIKDLQMLPGISPAIAKILADNGCRTVDDILEIGVDGLTAYRGIGEVRAEMIISAIQAMV